MRTCDARSHAPFEGVDDFFPRCATGYGDLDWFCVSSISSEVGLARFRAGLFIGVWCSPLGVWRNTLSWDAVVRPTSFATAPRVDTKIDSASIVVARIVQQAAARMAPSPCE
jgi:hypothetical protein